MVYHAQKHELTTLNLDYEDLDVSIHLWLLIIVKAIQSEQLSKLAKSPSNQDIFVKRIEESQSRLCRAGLPTLPEQHK